MSTGTFHIKSDYKPTGDQPAAIAKLVAGVKAGKTDQVLLGVTGSGKTFTVANVIAAVQKPTLIIAHNKTLAAQLYQEFKEFFPDNAVSYFVSYYDFYQPEAYIPQTDTYIEKETEINEEIDKLRLQATTNLLTRKDTIVVASVSCIYNLGSPQEYSKFILRLSANPKGGSTPARKEIIDRLLDLQYERSEFDFKRGTFRVRGEHIDIYPSYGDFGIRVGNKLQKIDPLTGKILANLESFDVYPAKHYMTDPAKYRYVFEQIRKDTQERCSQLPPLEAQRLKQRVNYDLEMIQEVGYVNGIENYSRYFDGRAPGDPPFSLLTYFPADYLLVVDESHMTIPQIRGMYNGDRSRKQTLIDFGFRLPAALDNRPLRFDEFLRRKGQTIYTSATPDDWEQQQAGGEVVEQLIRPTGIADPEVEVRKTVGQIQDLIAEIESRVTKKQRVLVTTLTKRMAEELTDYLKENAPGIKVAYLHSDIQTLDRTQILRKLRLGEYDVLVGINLLREGLDLPEVTLVAILDADKEGFLRSEVSLIQTMGRGARNIESRVIMYADNVTGSMKRAIAEVRRRRQIQLDWNKAHHITPKTIIKAIRENIIETPQGPVDTDIDIDQLLPQEKTKLKKKLEKQMKQAATILDFESATYYRDQIKKLTQW
ncbi:MAG: excinuclease ABC subunit UvrB [Patescibacteria group bacterium]|nr:excinuclease ABC subunit UvrB [Patescibacteria group bacterium]MCL5431848.1 excinuclease ABC subunit UvrB [Patescibacteria group bacterium]